MVGIIHDYAKFVDKGVQGAISSKSVNTSSPYKFKLPYPSANHLKEIERWIKEKNVTAIVTAPKGLTSLIKNKKLSASLKPSTSITQIVGQKSLAFAIGTQIKKRGLKATYFKSKVIEKLRGEFKQEVINAARRDISISIAWQ